MKTQSLTLALLTLVSAACGHDKDKKNIEVTPSALSVANFQNPSFGLLAWEDKCTGTKQFFVDFQKNYMPDTEITFGKVACKGLKDLYNTILDSIDVSFKRGDVQLDLSYVLQLNFDNKTMLLNPYPSILMRHEPKLGGNFEYRPEDAAISPNLMHLNKTLAQWREADSKAPVKVLGYTYAELAQKVNTTFGVQTEGMKLTEPNVRFQFVPGTEGPGAGTVKFLEADLSTYTTTDESGAVVPRKFQNCLDLACLQSSKITYWIAGTYITILSPEFQVEDEDGKHVRQEDFRVSLEFMRAK